MLDRIFAISKNISDCKGESMMKSTLTMLLKCCESADNMDCWYSWIRIRMWYVIDRVHRTNESGRDSLEDLEPPCGH